MFFGIVFNTTNFNDHTVNFFFFFFFFCVCNNLKVLIKLLQLNLTTMFSCVSNNWRVVIKFLQLTLTTISI